MSCSTAPKTLNRRRKVKNWCPYQAATLALKSAVFPRPLAAELVDVLPTDQVRQALSKHVSRMLNPPTHTYLSTRQLSPS
jgi:hypothetical protein